METVLSTVLTYGCLYLGATVIPLLWKAFHNKGIAN